MPFFHCILPCLHQNSTKKNPTTFNFNFQVVDSEALLKAYKTLIQRSFQRRRLQETLHPEWTEEERGAKRVRSLLYHLSNLQEIPVTMASLFLLRGHKPPSVASHTSVTLNLALLMAMAQGNDQTFMLRQHQDGSLIPSLPVQK